MALQVDRHLRLDGHSPGNIFAAGDCTNLPEVRGALDFGMLGCCAHLTDLPAAALFMLYAHLHASKQHALLVTLQKCPSS